MYARHGQAMAAGRLATRGRARACAAQRAELAARGRARARAARRRGPVQHSALGLDHPARGQPALLGPVPGARGPGRLAAARLHRALHHGCAAAPGRARQARHRAARRGLGLRRGQTRASERTSLAGSTGECISLGHAPKQAHNRASSALVWSIVCRRKACMQVLRCNVVAPAERPTASASTLLAVQARRDGGAHGQAPRPCSPTWATSTASPCRSAPWPWCTPASSRPTSGRVRARGGRRPVLAAPSCSLLAFVEGARLLLAAVLCPRQSRGWGQASCTRICRPPKTTSRA